MEYSAFMNINSLSEDAKRELEAFYDYLIFKYKLKNQDSTTEKKDRFEAFLSKSLKVDFFQMQNREERNER